VTLKLQGLALLFGPSLDRLRPWVAEAVRIFGPRRSMFASHFPVDRLLWSFDDLVTGLLTILEDLAADERSAFFAGCATERYGLA
jgi:predicted TIM-barrel fold metal-dependent hydrolase